MTNPNLDATMKEIDNSSFCPKAKRDAKKIFRAFAGEKEEETYAVGQWFAEKSGDKYVLASVGTNRVLLVHPDDGTRWGDPISVKDTRHITVAEFSMFVDNENFTRIEKPC